MKKRTLIVTLEYPPQIGGVASYVYNLAKNLPADSTIVYAPVVGGAEEFDAKNPWKTIRQKPYFLFFWPKWLRLFFQIRKIVKKEKIEQLYVHHALPVGYVAYLISKIRKIPYCIFFHGTDLALGLRKKPLLKKVCEGAERICVNSAFMKQKFVSLFEKMSQKIFIVYPSPDVIFFQKYPEAELKKLKSQLALEGKKVVITVSRMAEGKGYPHLIRLMPKILEKVPNIAWVVIGDGPKKRTVIELIQKNYLQNVTRFLGEVPYDELPKYYQVADLFVLLTHPDETAEEGWGTVFVEAAASGLPVVAGRAGGVEEAVQNLQTGLIVDVYQDQSIVAAITDLLRETEYAKKMGQAGAERAAREFNWQKQLARLL
ncbi:MAG: glycosyltransferase family 4 protein [Patescibacteria group bacterium]